MTKQYLTKQNQEENLRKLCIESNEDPKLMFELVESVKVKKIRKRNNSHLDQLKNIIIKATQ